MSAAKAKGTAFETLIVNYLQSCGWRHARRIALAGALDKGDITLGDGYPVVIEAKNTKTISLATFLNEVEVEKTNANAVVGLAWIKRPRKGTAEDAYVVMSGGDAERLLHLAFGRQS